MRHRRREETEATDADAADDDAEGDDELEDDDSDDDDADDSDGEGTPTEPERSRAKGESANERPTKAAVAATGTRAPARTTMPYIDDPVSKIWLTSSSRPSGDPGTAAFGRPLLHPPVPTDSPGCRQPSPACPPPTSSTSPSASRRVPEHIDQRQPRAQRDVHAETLLDEHRFGHAKRRPLGNSIGQHRDTACAAGSDALNPRTGPRPSWSAAA
jgi:hypothetical protein